MENKLFSKLVIIAAVFLQCGAAYSQQNTQKPNVIYIYADDLGYAEIGPYGQKKIKTPNLHKMANRKSMNTFISRKKSTRTPM